MFVTYLAVIMTNVNGVTTDTMVEEDTVEEDILILSESILWRS